MSTGLNSYPRHSHNLNTGSSQVVNNCALKIRGVNQPPRIQNIFSHKERRSVARRTGRRERAARSAGTAVCILRADAPGPAALGAAHRPGSAVAAESHRPARTRNDRKRGWNRAHQQFRTGSFGRCCLLSA